MDEMTRTVREMYERYPYPSQAEGTVADVHPRLMLSYLAPISGPLEILDAGCGTGMACLGTALCNPDCQVTAVDINRVALERVGAQAERLGLRNLRLLELDLTRDDLPGGYHLIVSSGVLHHLSDPPAALARLTGWLHPQGILRLMVYNTHGRAALYRFVQALELVAPRHLPLDLRLQAARALMAGLQAGPANAAPWDDANSIPEVEFVDRYLHPQDRSYTVAEYLELTQGAGLEMLRWYEPRDWTASSVGAALELPDEQLWSVIELLGHRKQLDALFCHPGAARIRSGTQVALSPQVTWTVCRRLAGTTLVSFAASVVVRDGPEELLNPLERALLEKLGTSPCDVAELGFQLGSLFSPTVLQATLDELLRKEVLYLSER